VDGRHRNTFIFPYGYFPVGRGSSYVRRREPQDFLGQAHAGTIPHFTIFAAVILALEKMPVFDAVCHALTALSTGGFSPHDSSIEFYSSTGHPNYRLIEYTLTFLMMLGGINFLIHYRVLTRDFKALWDNTEIRYWWRLIAGFTAIIIIDHLYKSGAFSALFRGAHVPAQSVPGNVYSHNDGLWNKGYRLGILRCAFQTIIHGYDGNRRLCRFDGRRL